MNRLSALLSGCALSAALLANPALAHNCDDASRPAANEPKPMSMADAGTASGAMASDPAETPRSAAAGNTPNGEVTLNGVIVPEGEIERVQNHCDTLDAAERQAMADGAEGQGDHEENPDGEGEDGPTDNAAGQGNAEGLTSLTEAEDATTVVDADFRVDLDTVTLEMCAEAGLVELAQQ